MPGVSVSTIFYIPISKCTDQLCGKSVLDTATAAQVIPNAAITIERDVAAGDWFEINATHKVDKGKIVIQSYSNGVPGPFDEYDAFPVGTTLFVNGVSLQKIVAVNQVSLSDPGNSLMDEGNLTVDEGAFALVATKPAKYTLTLVERSKVDNIFYQPSADCTPQLCKKSVFSDGALTKGDKVLLKVTRTLSAGDKFVVTAAHAPGKGKITIQSYINGAPGTLDLYNAFPVGTLLLIDGGTLTADQQATEADDVPSDTEIPSSATTDDPGKVACGLQAILVGATMPQAGKPNQVEVYKSFIGNAASSLGKQSRAFKVMNQTYYSAPNMPIVDNKTGKGLASELTKKIQDRLMGGTGVIIVADGPAADAACIAAASIDPVLRSRVKVISLNPLSARVTVIKKALGKTNKSVLPAAYGDLASSSKLLKTASGTSDQCFNKSFVLSRGKMKSSDAVKTKLLINKVTDGLASDAEGAGCHDPITTVTPTPIIPPTAIPAATPVSKPTTKPTANPTLIPTKVPVVFSFGTYLSNPQLFPEVAPYRAQETASWTKLTNCYGSNGTKSGGSMLGIQIGCVCGIDVTVAEKTVNDLLSNLGYSIDGPALAVIAGGVQAAGDAAANRPNPRPIC